MALRPRLHDTQQPLVSILIFNYNYGRYRYRDTVERFKKIKDARVQAFFRTLRTVKSEKEDER